jgi:hypothetical protein
MKILEEKATIVVTLENTVPPLIQCCLQQIAPLERHSKNTMLGHSTEGFTVRRRFFRIDL